MRLADNGRADNGSVGFKRTTRPALCLQPRAIDEQAVIFRLRLAMPVLLFTVCARGVLAFRRHAFQGQGFDNHVAIVINKPELLLVGCLKGPAHGLNCVKRHGQGSVTAIVANKHFRFSCG